jgi:nucleotide-binding universal stress UspA family protein
MKTQLSPLGRFEKILFATDGSEFSAGAERVAMGMAAKSGAKLSIMTVALAGSDPGGMGDSEVARFEAEATARLDAVEARVTAAGLSCTKVIRFGDDPYKEIVGESAEHNADVIVLGRRGKRGLARLMLGDATVKVIGDARCSVLVVPKACDMWGKRVLVATDGSRSGDAAAHAAMSISRCCGAPITVMSVRNPRHDQARQDEAERIVDRVLRFYQDEGVVADGVVVTGVPSKAINAMAAERGADLIVMGSHGRTGLGRLILGSNSEAVINETTCPVMVVKG